MKQGQTVAMAVYHSQVKALRHGLLEQITYGLGDREKFPNYYKEVDSLSKSVKESKEPSIIVNNCQNVGNNSSAGNGIAYRDINSSTNIKTSEPAKMST
ncbi:MAG: hypothetical protein HQL05_04620 [Nitrospirae bacterium]|nr:hypothetical protein [Nitrospirota bacterium]